MCGIYEDAVVIFMICLKFIQGVYLNSTLSFLMDLLLFMGLPWLIWVGVRKKLPLAVIPILVGMVISGLHLPIKSLGLPSPLGNSLGLIGVILLAFTAGLEMRHSPEGTSHGGSRPMPALRPLRIGLSALFALGLPFMAATLVSYHHFLNVPAWVPEHGKSWLAAMAIGLCIAVSALPVLVGLVQEFAPAHKVYGYIALTVALLDDVVLWLGLGAIQIAANIHGGPGFGHEQLMAAYCLAALFIFSLVTNRHSHNVPGWLAWLVALVYLFGGAWASERLGVHELIGAYFAGALLPPHWMKKIHIERVGKAGLVLLAPLFFGHSGLNVNGSVLGWSSLGAAMLLLLISVVTKVGAAVLIPPVGSLSWRERFGVGSLLQCKGLMEIVAATLLHAQGLLSEYAYAALVTLAVISTTITAPIFRAILPLKRMQGDDAGSGDAAPPQNLVPSAGMVAAAAQAPANQGH